MSWPSPLLLALLLALGACSNSITPHWGNPGAASRQLAIPLAVRLAIRPPPEALLDDTAARRLAEAVADGLQAADVPAISTVTPLPLDWKLDITAAVSGAQVQPRFAIRNADGREQGVVETTPVAARNWAEATPELIGAVAAQAVPRVTQMLLSVQAARAAASPSAISAGPPRVRFIPITGAPGDGNTALTSRMRGFLGNLGYVMQDTAEGAAFAVTAEVAVLPVNPATQRVEIQWIVSRRDGHELGRVVQLNEVPAGSLSRFWGDVAYVAAEQAAGGVQTIIRNASTPG
ncbi:hypothetical protein EJV46_04270 [Roseococcus sp. SYP-B2431]|uniref:hypothetical protein n=1 Tax=Roseococcus sp. SYP-B2431 TaxID=2496640 RepID=UPI001038CBE6|nr:hypothetical protein [Roseococcus sp. SYP-B2431]TCH99887.1 hypothetical protein EJV46_04270 [Roseococcus sp. SYP-B2431]